MHADPSFVNLFCFHRETISVGKIMGCESFGSGVKIFDHTRVYTKSFRSGRLEGELQMTQLFATRCSCIAILWVSLVSFFSITLCAASQRVFIIIISLLTQSGKFWIYPRILHGATYETKKAGPKFDKKIPSDGASHTIYGGKSLVS
jgi:hypothetical protein